MGEKLHSMLFFFLLAVYEFFVKGNDAKVVQTFIKASLVTVRLWLLGQPLLALALVCTAVAQCLFAFSQYFNYVLV